jgi:hypothetical protein
MNEILVAISRERERIEREREALSREWGMLDEFERLASQNGAAKVAKAPVDASRVAVAVRPVAVPPLGSDDLAGETWGYLRGNGAKSTAELVNVLSVESRDAMQAALAELRRDDRIERIGYGRWRALAPKPAEAPTEVSGNSPLMDRVLAFVAQNPGSAKGDMVREFGLSADVMKTPLRRLVEAGSIRRDGKASNVRYWPAGEENGTP